jgi:hypothetical protein
VAITTAVIPCKYSRDISHVKPVRIVEVSNREPEILCGGFCFLQWLDSPLGGLGRLIFRGFTVTRFRHTTFGRTPLDEGPACRRDLYLTTHNTHNRQTSMPPVGFEPTILVSERPQTHALDRTATGIGLWRITLLNRLFPQKPIRNFLQTMDIFYKVSCNFFYFLLIRTQRQIQKVTLKSSLIIKNDFNFQLHVWVSHIRRFIPKVFFNLLL